MADTQAITTNTDRVGNAYFPVGVWCIAGGLFAWKLLMRPAHASSLRRLPKREKPVTRFSEATALLWGWLLGGAAGLAVHHIPFQLVLMWYVLTGWQK